MTGINQMAGDKSDVNLLWQSSGGHDSPVGSAAAPGAAFLRLSLLVRNIIMTICVNGSDDLRYPDRGTPVGLVFTSYAGSP